MGIPPTKLVGSRFGTASQSKGRYALRVGPMPLTITAKK